MSRLAALAMLVSLQAVPGPALAQQPLTLSEAIAEALAANPRIRAAEAEADRAAANVSIARAAFFPQISYAESWQRSNQPVAGFSALLAARRFTSADFSIDRLNAPGGVSLFAGRLFIRQSIFDGRTRAEATAAGDERDMAIAEADAARAAVALQVTEVYGRLLAAEAAGRAAAAAVASADESLALAGRRREAGTATDADVLGLAVHRAAMRQRTIQASGDAAIARAELNRLMGGPPARSFVVADPDAAPASGATQTGAPDVLDIDALLREAAAQRPELRRSAHARAAAEAGIRGARAGWLPQIAAHAGYQAEGLSALDRADAWFVGGEFTWTVSVGGEQPARVRAATAARRAAEAAAADALAAVQVEVVSAVRRLEAARARVDLGTAAVADAAERERITRNRYDAGLASVTDVLSAATARLDAELDRTQARADVLVAEAMLTRAVGRPVNASHP
jgi:outer membrane protein TolC